MQTPLPLLATKLDRIMLLIQMRLEVARTLLPAFWKQHNFTLGLAVACAGKIQLRFQKRSHAAEVPEENVHARKKNAYNARTIGRLLSQCILHEVACREI